MAQERVFAQEKKTFLTINESSAW